MGFWEDAQPADAGGGLHGIFQNPRSTNVRPALACRLNGGACFGVARIRATDSSPFRQPGCRSRRTPAALGFASRPCGRFALFEDAEATGLCFAPTSSNRLYKMCRKELAEEKSTRDRPRGRSHGGVRDYVRLRYPKPRSTSRRVKSQALTIFKILLIAADNACVKRGETRSFRAASVRRDAIMRHRSLPPLAFDAPALSKSGAHRLSNELIRIETPSNPFGRRGSAASHDVRVAVPCGARHE